MSTLRLHSNTIWPNNEFDTMHFSNNSNNNHHKNVGISREKKVFYGICRRVHQSNKNLLVEKIKFFLDIINAEHSKKQN